MGVTGASDPAPRLRRANDHDAETIRELVAAAYEHYTTLIGRTPLPMLTDYAVAVREHEVWVLETADAIVSMLELVPHDDHLWIDNVAASPSQGRGFGRLLLAYADDEARSRDLPELRLLTNERYLAYVMYTWYGYRESHREPHLCTDLVYFAKSLHQADTSTRFERGSIDGVAQSTR